MESLKDRQALDPPVPPQKKRSALSIQSQLVCLLLVVLIPILLVEAAMFNNRLSGRRALALQVNLEVARALSKAFEAFIQDILHQEASIIKTLSSPRPSGEHDICRLLEHNKADYPAIQCFFFVDSSGQLVASGAPNAMGLDMSGEPFIQDVLAGKDMIISNLFLCRLTGKPVFVVGRSFKNEEGVLVGAVLAFISPNRLDSVLSIKREGHAGIGLLDREGTGVYRYPSAEQSWEGRSRNKDNPIIREALAGKEALGSVVTQFDDTTRVTAAVPIPSLGWVAVAGVPENEALEPIFSNLSFRSHLLAAPAFLAFLIAVFISRKIALPAKRLREHALLLGQGRFSGRIEAGGASELQDLAHALNTMAEKVRAREESLIEVQLQLEQRIQERTADLSKTNEAFKEEIIERSKAEDAVKAERERLFSLLNSFPAFVYLMAPDYSIRYANEYSKRSLFKSEGELCYRSHESTNGPCANCKAWEVLHTESPQRWESQDSPDGKTYQVYGYPFTDTDGSLLVLVLGFDITDRKRAEEALRESEFSYRTLSENLPGIVFRVFLREKGKMQFFNHMLESFTGFKPEELAQGEVCSLDPLIVAEDRARVIGIVERAIEDNQPFEVDYRLRVKDGTIRHFLERGMPVYGTDGDPLYIDGVVLDTTARVRAQDALRESEGQLRFLSSRLLSAQEEERKRIAVEIHDSLGSSLSAVKIALENARKQLQENAPMATALDTSISWTQHAIDEARRLMTDLRPSILDDLGLLATAGWFLRRFRTIHPLIHIEEELDIEESDIPEHLKIVIFRIMQEAFHNISKHGRAEFVNLSLAKTNGDIKLAIEDNGEGFDIDAALHVKNGRRGLGLTSMKERAELSGGDFSIESVLGEGTIIGASWHIKS